MKFNSQMRTIEDARNAVIALQLLCHGLLVVLVALIVMWASVLLSAGCNGRPAYAIAPLVVTIDNDAADSAAIKWFNSVQPRTKTRIVDGCNHSPQYRNKSHLRSVLVTGVAKVHATLHARCANVANVGVKVGVAQRRPKNRAMCTCTNLPISPKAPNTHTKTIVLIGQPYTETFQSRPYQSR